MYEMEIEQTLSQLLEKREVDDEALELRDKFIELFRKELRNLIEQTNKD